MTVRWNRWYLVLAAVILGIIFSLFYVAENQFVAPEREIAERSSRILEEQNALLSRADQQQQTEEEWLDDLEAVHIHLPQTEDADHLIQEINELIPSDTIEVERLIKDEGQSGIVSEVTSMYQLLYRMEINFSSLDDFHSLTDDLIHADRFIEIVEVEYHQVDTNSWEGFLLLRAYYLESSTGE